MPPSIQTPGPRFTTGPLGDWTYEQSLRYEQALCLIDGRIAACNAEIEKAPGSAAASTIRVQRLDLLRKRRALHVGDDLAIAEVLNQTQHV